MPTPHHRYGVNNGHRPQLRAQNLRLCRRFQEATSPAGRESVLTNPALQGQPLLPVATVVDNGDARGPIVRVVCGSFRQVDNMAWPDPTGHEGEDLAYDNVEILPGGDGIPHLVRAPDDWSAEAKVRVPLPEHRER